MIDVIMTPFLYSFVNIVLDEVEPDQVRFPLILLILYFSRGRTQKIVTLILLVLHAHQAPS